MIDIKIGAYKSRIEEIEEDFDSLQTKYFDWDTWDEDGTVQFISEELSPFDWKKWLKRVTRLSRHNLKRNINSEWGDEFQVYEWQLFQEHDIPDYEPDECDAVCLANNHLFWDYQYEYVWTDFIPELQIIAFSIWFEEHGYPLHLYFPIWELNQTLLELGEDAPI